MRVLVLYAWHCSALCLCALLLSLFNLCQCQSSEPVYCKHGNWFQLRQARCGSCLSILSSNQQQFSTVGTRNPRTNIACSRSHHVSLWWLALSSLQWTLCILKDHLKKGWRIESPTKRLRNNVLLILTIKINELSIPLCDILQWIHPLFCSGKVA